MNDEAIYCAVGRFVIAFQMLEDQFRQVIWFCTDPSRTGVPYKSMAGEGFAEAVKRAGATIYPFIAEWGGEKGAEVRGQFEEIAARSRALNQRRNRIVHSAYIFHEGHNELFGITRSYLKSAKEGKLDIEYEAINECTFDSAMAELADISFQLGVIHRQLTAWYR